MGYQVYWSNGRWQGYGVPAYCDYPGCKEEIDRGMGYSHTQDKEEPASVFCCDNHTHENINSFEVERKEHPDWLNHILTDDSWELWRSKNPESVKEYKIFLDITIKRV